MMTCNSLPFIFSVLFQTCFKPLFETQKKKKRYWTSNLDDTHVEELGYNCPGLPRANAIEFGMIAYEYGT
jgi:hypothetical protein